MKRGFAVLFVGTLCIGALLVASNVSAQVIVSVKKVKNKITAIDPILTEPGQGDEHLCHATIAVYRYPSCTRGKVYSTLLSFDASNPPVCSITPLNSNCHSQSIAKFKSAPRKMCSADYRCGYTPGVSTVFIDPL